MVWFVGFGYLRKHRAKVADDMEVWGQRVFISKTCQLTMERERHLYKPKQKVVGSGADPNLSQQKAEPRRPTAAASPPARQLP